MADTKELSWEGIVEVLDLHRIKFTYTKWIPYELLGTCECGWQGNTYDAPVTTSDLEPSRVQTRRECLEHIADILFEEAAPPTITKE